jgi:hypothetical protein
MGVLICKKLLLSGLLPLPLKVLLIVYPGQILSAVLSNSLLY